MKKYNVKKECFISGKHHKLGTVVELADMQAKYLLLDGSVKLVIDVPIKNGKK